MRDTTTYTDLTRISPNSETHWRAIAARAHRLRSEAGDEAAALTHETFIHEIRNCLSTGSSRTLRFCPRCLERFREEHHAALDRRQALWKGTSTRPVTLARRRHFQRLVWPSVIIDRTPTVKGALALAEIGEFRRLIE